MGGVRTKIAKCILNIGRSSEPSFEVCGQSCKVRSKLGNYKTTLRAFELKSETRFEKQPETESNLMQGQRLFGLSACQIPLGEGC